MLLYPFHQGHPSSPVLGPQHLGTQVFRPRQILTLLAVWFPGFGLGLELHHWLSWASAADSRPCLHNLMRYSLLINLLLHSYIYPAYILLFLFIWRTLAKTLSLVDLVEIKPDM